MAISISTVPTRAFAFSPSKIVISGATANQKIDFEFNGFFSTRYADALGDLTFPLSKVLKSAWATEEVGDVLPFTAFVNSSSKLIKSVVLNIKSNNAHILSSPYTISAIWGALQVAEVEPTVETIYKFGTLPLTITQNIGQYFRNSVVSAWAGNGIGKDIDVQALILQDTIVPSIKLGTGTDENPTYLKEIFIEELPYCSDSVYLRWIDRYGQYRYFAFLNGESANTVKQGDSYTKELLDLSPSVNGLYKTQNQLIDNSGSPVIGISVPTATYAQQKFLQGLETAIKVYKHLGSNQWVEVGCAVESIKIDERWKQNKSVNLAITMPNLYLPTL